MEVPIVRLKMGVSGEDFPRKKKWRSRGEWRREIRKKRQKEEGDRSVSFHNMRAMRG